MKVGACKDVNPLIKKNHGRGGGVSGQPENPLDTPLWTVPYRRWSCDRCVTKWRIGMYKNTMGHIKNTTDVCWGCILVECVQATCHFLRAPTFTGREFTKHMDGR